MSIEIALTTDSSFESACVLCWETSSWMQLRAYKQGVCPRNCLTMLFNSFIVASQVNKPFLHVWDVSKEQMHRKMTSPANITALAFSPSGAYCAAASSETIYIWQVTTGNLLGMLSRHFQPITCLKFTDDGSYLISGADDNLVSIWSLVSILPTGVLEVENITPKYTWSEHSLPITSIHVGRGGKHANVVTSSLDHTCKLWSLSSGKLLRSFTFDVAILSVIMDAAEYRLFAGGFNGKIYATNLFSQAFVRAGLSEHNETQCFVGHSMQVTSISVSMDGLTLLSGSKDCTARVWDVPSRQCLRVLQHRGSVENVQIRPRHRNFDVKLTKTSLPILGSFKRCLHDSSSVQDNVPVRLNSFKALKRLENNERDLCDNMIKEHCDDHDHEGGKKNLSKTQLKEQLETAQKLNKSLYKFATEELLSDVRLQTNVHQL
ncbi:WD repeat-containing protein 18-like [Xenia sp. Carnegie-2017]|uniref:WD repeat-containing protein 18-like n=1 Tax=Xenia sp. Carnegie-2017 TaxID=2897299 RepID=UPI001F04B263|nr:WD repeat-containing protein 18-like [Xenia sp. Carnegie-2017]